MRALPEILKKRRDVKVLIVGGDGVSYGRPPSDILLATTMRVPFSSS